MKTSPALRQLPKARVESSLEVEADGALRVHLHNPSSTLAFQVAVTALGKDGSDISPLPWSDNYIELLPGESRTLLARPLNAEPEASIVVSGWNIASTTLKPHPRETASREPGPARASHGK